MKTYKGRYTPKNPNKYDGDASNIVYRSLWEKHAFKWCDTNSNIIKWSSEETVIPYYCDIDKRYHRYFPDLKIETKEGKVFIVEIKPDKETRKPEYPGRRTKRYITEGLTYVRNQNKWEAANEYALDRGYQFVVWTENNEPLKTLIPKSTKRLAPYQRKKK